MGNGRKESRRPASQRAGYDEHWLEHEIRTVLHSVLDEPLPAEFLELANRLPDAPGGEAVDRARRWRAWAEEIRTAAESMTNETARSALLQMARNYDALASQAEGGTQQAAGRKGEAG